MVGDRLDTDVARGRGAGLDAALVLSGGTTREEAEAARAPRRRRRWRVALGHDLASRLACSVRPDGQRRPTTSTPPPRAIAGCWTRWPASTACTAWPPAASSRAWAPAVRSPPISKVRRTDSGLSITINTDGAIIDAYVVTDRADEVAAAMPSAAGRRLRRSAGRPGDRRLALWLLEAASSFDRTRTTSWSRPRLGAASSRAPLPVSWCEQTLGPPVGPASRKRSMRSPSSGPTFRRSTPWRWCATAVSIGSARRLSIVIDANVLIALALNDPREPLVDRRLRDWSSEGETLRSGPRRTATRTVVAKYIENNVRAINLLNDIAELRDAGRSD